MTKKIKNPLPEEAKIKALISVDPGIKSMFDAMQTHVQPTIEKYSDKARNEEELFILKLDILGHLHCALVEQIKEVFKDFNLPKEAFEEFIKNNLKLASMPKIPPRGRN